MVKLVGAALCFLTSFLIGIFAGKNERERTAQCEAFLELFEYVKNQVGFFLGTTRYISTHGRRRLTNAAAESS